MDFSDLESRSTELSRKIKERKAELKDMIAQVNLVQQIIRERKEKPVKKKEVRKQFGTLNPLNTLFLQRQQEKYFIDSDVKDRKRKTKKSSNSLDHESLTNLIKNVEEIKKMISVRKNKVFKL